MALTPQALELIALALGIVGFACLGWPVLMRLTGRAQADPIGSGKSLRSLLWWTGFVLTVTAVGLLRVASGQGG